MANTFKFIDMVAREALAIAHEKCAFIGTVDRQYDDSYADKGAKFGSTLRVRNPNKYTRRTGSRVMSVQDTVETTQNIVVATQDGVDLTFNAAELTLDTNSPKEVAAFSKRYIEPAMSVLTSGIEADFLAYATKATYNTAGTAGTALTDLAVPGAARAKINQALAPKDGNRFIQADSITMSSMVNGLKGLFQDSTQLKEQYREGMLGRNAMADWYENERVWSMTNGSDVTGTTDAAALVTDGGNTVDMHTTILTSANVVGQVFTIAGVYPCHPETKAVMPGSGLQQFTITAIGATTLTVSPTIYLTGANKNVCSSLGATLATTDFNSKTVTFVGAASTSYAASLMYHKDAFQFVTADLALLDPDPSRNARQTQDGLSIRVWQAPDILNDRLLLRLDMLYGFAALRPEWACRMIGAASA